MTALPPFLRAGARRMPRKSRCTYCQAHLYRTISADNRLALAHLARSLMQLTAARGPAREIGQRLIQTPTLSARKQARREVRARLNRLAQQERPDLAVCGELCREIESLDKEIEQLQAA